MTRSTPGTGPLSGLLLASVARSLASLPTGLRDHAPLLELAPLPRIARIGRSDAYSATASSPYERPNTAVASDKAFPCWPAQYLCCGAAPNLLASSWICSCTGHDEGRSHESASANERGPDQ